MLTDLHADFSRGRSGGLVFHLFQNFPQFIVIHTVKGFGIVNKAEIDIFLELSCFFHDLADVGNLISVCSAFSKTSLNIRKFMVHILLKPGLENSEHYFTSMWDECNCAVVWAFFGIAFLWDWNENWHFPVPWPLLGFPNLLAYWVQHFKCILMSFMCNMMEQIYDRSIVVFLFVHWKLWMKFIICVCVCVCVYIHNRELIPNLTNLRFLKNLELLYPCFKNSYWSYLPFYIEKFLRNANSYNSITVFKGKHHLLYKNHIIFKF